MLPAWELFNHERAGASSLPALSFFYCFYSSGFFIGFFCHADFADDKKVSNPMKKDLSRQGELDAQTEVLCRRRITAA